MRNPLILKEMLSYCKSERDFYSFHLMNGSKAIGIYRSLGFDESAQFLVIARDIHNKLENIRPYGADKNGLTLLDELKLEMDKLFPGNSSVIL